MESDYITPEAAGTLAGLLRERLRRTPDKAAYRHFEVASKTWADTTWRDMATEVGRWQQALLKEDLAPGDRVAVMLRNSREWVLIDQAALGLGLVVVPLYVNDRPGSVAYIVEHAEVKLLVVEGRRQWRELQRASNGLDGITRIVTVSRLEPDDRPEDPRLTSLSNWLFGLEGPLQALDGETDELATIVYTSGTTGRPKGVMLSHRNVLANAHASARCGEFGNTEVFLSFLPLSHTLERTAGYYLAMMIGGLTAFSRGIPQLAEDLRTVRPTILISVPRVYETLYARIMARVEQESPLRRGLFELARAIGWRRFERRHGRGSWSPSLMLWPVLERLVADPIRKGLGGRLSFAISGGAALPSEVARLFLSLGLPIYQGYGLTEASPTVTVNRIDDTKPDSIGLPLPGVEVRIGEHDEILTRSVHVMLGYWDNPAATAEAIDAEGWLHTGDQGRVDADGHYFIIGRLKEIIGLSSGEKMPPADMELAISIDSLFDHVMVFGEGKPYLVAVAVLDRRQWTTLARDLALDPEDPAALADRVAEKAALARISARLTDFPGYAQIRRAHLTTEPWTIDEGLLTPTLKPRRQQIQRRFAAQIEALYEPGPRRTSVV